MTDRAIAAQLKALADDSERRAEKPSHVDAAIASLNRPLTKASSVHDLTGSFTVQPAEEMPGDVEMFGAAKSRASYAFVTACRTLQLRLISHIDLE